MNNRVYHLDVMGKTVAGIEGQSLPLTLQEHMSLWNDGDARKPGSLKCKVFGVATRFRISDDEKFLVADVDLTEDAGDLTGRSLKVAGYGVLGKDGQLESYVPECVYFTSASFPVEKAQTSRDREE